MANITDTQLAASNGASLVGFSPSGVPDQVRTAEGKLRDTVSVKDFGAIGDQFFHPLSASFASLADAQAAFGPHVTSLSQSVDWAAIQAAINAMEPLQGTVFFPRGRYVLSSGDSLKIPNLITLRGEGPASSIIDNQNHAFTGALAVNKNSAGFVHTIFEHLGFHGGTTGLDINVTLEVAGLIFNNVSFQLQSEKNLGCNMMLKTSKFNQCIFAGASYGVKVDDRTTNAVDFISCDFTNHAFSHIYLRSAEVVNFLGCRFEDGGVAGRKTIDLADARNVTFKGCYFEKTHEYLLSESSSSNSVGFDDCHFTGWNGPSGLAPYLFQSDGIVQFGSNSWYKGSDGPARMMMTGMNNDALGSNNTLYFAHSRARKHIVSPSVPVPASLQKNLVRFSRNAPSGAVTNLQTLTGTLIVNALSLEAGGFGKSFSRKYHVRLEAVGLATIGCQLVLASDAGPASGASMTVQAKSGATASELILEAVFTGLNPGTAITSSLQWSVDYIAASTTGEFFQVALA